MGVNERKGSDTLYWWVWMPNLLIVTRLPTCSLAHPEAKTAIPPVSEEELRPMEAETRPEAL